MKSKTNLITTGLQFTAFVAAIALAGNVSAASLGMNWVNDGNGNVQNGNSDSMAASDVAGAPGFSQANWNNLGRWGDNVNLVDSTGTASGVLVAWDATGVWNNGASTATGDGKMMNGYIDSNGGANTTLANTIYGNDGNNKPLVYFSGISAFLAAQGACNYDVVIYVSGDTAGRVGEYWLVAGTGSASSGWNTFTWGSNLTTPVFMKAPAPFNGTYTQVPLSSTAGATAATGNYVVFTNLTADSFLLRTEEYDTRAPINGVQIWPHLAGAPVIGSSATAQTNYGGQTIQLTVTATACVAPTYQWQAGAIGSGVYTNVQDGGNISGATATSLTISNAALANSADYIVIAANNSGSATSAVMSVTVVPAIIAAGPTPASEVLYPGATAHFSASAQATAPTFTWRKAGVPLSDGGRISGSATNLLNISNVSAGDDVSYDLVVTTAYGSVTSTVATLSLLAAPAVGTFAESVITNNALAYWRLDETAGPTAFDYAGGFNGTYLANSLPAQTGPQPPDFLGFESSNTGVGINPGGIIQDQSWVTVPALNMITNAITVVAWVNPVQNQQAWTGIFMTRSGISGGLGFSGTANELAYTWNNDSTWVYHSGLIVPNNQLSMVAMVMTAANTTLYVGNTNSGLISWFNPLTNAVQSWTGSAMIGDDQNATGRAYAGLIDEVAVFNHSLSPAAILSLYAAGRAAGVLPPTLTAQPVPVELYAGRTAQFTVTASGTAPLAYQWRMNGVPMQTGGNVAGVTSATLTLTGVAAGNVASYDVVVTNSAGSVTSSVAALTLTAPTGSAYEAAVIAAAPFAYWRLNEANGSTNAFDAYGGHTAAYGIYANPGVPGPLNTEYSGFESANTAVALTPNSPGSWVSVLPLNLDTNTVTITAWIYPNADNQTNAAIFFQRQGLTVAGLTYDGVDGTRLGYNWNNDGGTYGFASGLTIAPYQWSFVALVVEPAKATLYLYTTNTQYAAANVLTHPNQGFAGTSYIGNDVYGTAGERIFNGVIDETAVWNRALTSEQIAALYTAASGAQFAPKITVQPVSQSLYAGLSAQFTASAAGSATLTYHWQKNGTPLTDGGTLSGATTPKLNVTGATLGDAGDYALVVANSQGSVTSQVATLTLLPSSARIVWTAPAAITTADATLTQSGSVVGAEVFGGVEKLVTLTGGAGLDFKADGSVATATGTGTGNLAFDPNTTGNLNFDAVLNEFNHDGGPKTITINGLIPGHQYGVQLFGLDNRPIAPNYNEMSRRAYFQDAYDTNDVSATFYMSNNVYVIGTFTAAGTNQVIREVLPGLDGGTAQVGNGNINALVLRDLSPAPTIASQPVSLTRYAGATASFTVTSFGPPPMYYQWQKRTGGEFANDGAVGTIAVPVSTPVTLSIPSVSAGDAADYRLVVTNSSGSATSQVATLTVITPASGSYAASVIAGHPLAYYRLNEAGNAASGTLVAYDYVGGHDGLYGSAATNGVPGPAGSIFSGLEANNTAVETTAGLINSWVKAPFGTLGINTATFAMWLYPIGTQPNWAGILVTRGGGVEGGLNYNGQGMLGYTWNNNSTWSYVSGLVIPSDQWSFVATVIEPTQATLYLYNSSGQLSATNVIAHTPDVFGGNWLIGADGTDGTRAFNGVIDEVAVYASALTPAQIGQLYFTATPPMKLSIQQVGADVKLSWPQGTLLQADALAGPWTTNTAASPYTVLPSAAKKFYRVIVQ
jgi:hypothetical protein